MKNDIIPEYKFHTDEDLIKVNALNYEIIEELQNYIKVIDKIDLCGNETLISIKLFTIAYIDFYSEIINLFELKFATGIDFYSRNLIELTMYIRGLTMSDKFLSYLKADNYKQLRAIRNDWLGKKLVKANKVNPEIEILNNRINEYSDLIINGKKVTLNSTFESLFTTFDCERLYSNHYRYFSRKVHVNIFEIQSRYKKSSGLVFKPKLLFDDFILSQLAIFECNQFMLSSLRISLGNIINEKKVDEKNNEIILITRKLNEKHKTNVT